MVADMTEDTSEYKDFDPTNTEDIKKLSAAVGYSRKTLEVFREKRRDLLKQFVGKHYSDTGADDKVPINFLELALNIYLQRLVAKAPQVSISTDFLKLKEVCTRFEMAANHLVEEIDLGVSLEGSVTGAMFSIGIAKVGLNRTQHEVGGVLHDAGQPFCDFVSLEDWVQDMTADKPENWQYEGNFYNITMDEARKLFPDKKNKLFARDSQTSSEQRDHDISEGESTQREEFRDVVRLLDLWLPKQNLLIQCLASEDSDFTDPIAEVLNVIEWEGPERGPYHKLGFSWIENNTMPVAPAMYWKDMHTLANSLFRKVGRQADREKTVHTVRNGGTQDGQRVVDASDGEMVRVDDPKNVGEIHTGGVNATTLGLVVLLKDFFAYFAGNLDTLGGLGPQSETLGQDQLLSASASMRIQKMQKETIRFTTGIIKDLCFYLWNDPYIEIPLVKRLKGYEDITIPVKFGPQDRENDFVEYNIKIEPYSMQHQTPESKLQGLRTVMAEFVAPLLPMMEQQGIGLDIEMLFKKIGKLGNLTELSDIITYSNPQHQTEPVGQSAQGGKPPVTKRTYERVNRPGATRSGKDQIMQQALFGGNPQNSEKAAIMRPTG